jgi:peptide chain release factor subunit 1
MAGRQDRDPPAPGQPALVEAERVDPEHPHRPAVPVRLSTRSLREVARDLRVFESPDVPVVSVYWEVPADPGQLRGATAELKDLARVVRDGAASKAVPHAARESLRADAQRVLELGDLVPKLHGRTLGFFTCHARGFEEAVVLPADLPTLVTLGPTPFIRPVLAVMDEARRYAVVVVDREHAWLFEFSLGALEAHTRVDDRALRDPNFAAGDKEYGVHHKALELAKRHYRDAAQALRQLVGETGSDLVVVGGHESTISAFVDQLPHDLRRMVVGAFAIDPQSMTPASVRDAAQRAVDEHTRSEKRQLVTQALDRTAVDGFGAIGLEWCLVAANERAVDHLLVEAGFTTPGRVCDTCGWLATTGDRCPVDGSATRPTADVVDEMVIRVVDSSGHVHLIDSDDDDRLRDQRVAAILRFPVPSPALG